MQTRAAQRKRSPEAEVEGRPELELRAEDLEQIVEQLAELLVVALEREAEDTP